MLLACRAMALADTLGYRIKPGNPIQRGFQALGSTPPGAWFFSWLLPRVDPLVFRLSGGKTTLPALLAGLPVVMVTSTGAKSGKARTAPLVGIPVDGELALIGTNFGQGSTPGWVYNLEADPSGSIAYRNCQADFTARPAAAEEVDAAIESAAAVYPGYAAYRRRITGRPIRVFFLREA